MIPAGFEYVRAKTLGQALTAAATKDTKVLAGGQSLIPLLRFRFAQPKRLVDIGGLAQLKGIKATPKGLRIGSLVTYRELLDSALVRKTAPLIAEVTEHVGDRQVRNLGTIGGSVAHADPASDMPAVLLALGASITVRSKRGVRTIPVSKFFLGAFSSALKKGELVTDIMVPSLPKGAGTAYSAVEQAASGYPLVAAAVVVAKSKGAVSHASLAFTGLSDHAFLAASASQLLGTQGTADDVTHVAEAAAGGVEPNSDIHASGDYRLHLAKVTAERALAQALERAK
jgi:carbon-monoxide dehydrogenase medium subunit